MTDSKKSLRVVFWGTYDLGKPRVRILLAGLKGLGEEVEVIECHSDIWEGVEDKSQLRFRDKVYFFFRLSLAYPLLIWRYISLPAHDAVIVGYLGHLDVLVLWPFAKLRGAPIVWDVFIPIYDTVVNDRKMISRKSPMAWILYVWEWLACRAARRIFLDTETHAQYFKDLFHLPMSRIDHVQVGVEVDIFPRSAQTKKKECDKPFTVLFYGQFIPLHGIDVIVKAAHIAETSGKKMHWILIGRGQEEKHIDSMIYGLKINSIERINWVPYEQLAEWIRRADVCLGIFGTTGKAYRVIPNKVYQILAVGRPLITGDTPAIRELLCEAPSIRLIPSGDPQALADAVVGMMEQMPANNSGERAGLVIDSHHAGRQLNNILAEVVKG